MKIILSPNPYRDKGLRTARAADRMLRELGEKPVFCLPFSVEYNATIEMPKGIKYHAMQEELDGADLIICFGGDGTILHAAKAAKHHDVPILGINMGSVGFMAELEHNELSMLKKLVTGDYRLENRMMLDVRVLRGGRAVFEDTILNDAVVSKGAVARGIECVVLADGIQTFRSTGDGVIVSTPTGSTAYSMSAGGPIVEPTAENLIVTPICAHTLYARSVVLGAARTVEVNMGKLARRTAYLSTDGGKAFRLAPEDIVEVKRSQSVTKLVRLTDRTFYEIVNQKLNRP